LHILPTLWFRNTWSWGSRQDRTNADDSTQKPRLFKKSESAIGAEQATLGQFTLHVESASPGRAPQLLFTENYTNAQRVFGVPNGSPWVKDSFHDYVIAGAKNAVNPANEGTKSAAYFQFNIPAGGQVSFRLRLVSKDEEKGKPFSAEFDRTFAARRNEADDFF